MDTTDRRATRKVVASEQGRLDADADSARRIRDRKAKLELKQQKRTADRQDANAKDASKRGKRKQSALNRKAWIDARVEYVRNNAAGTYSSVIYGAAVTGAVYGQITAGWSWYIGLPVAVALEGFTLSMALTAHAQRMIGERATAARILTWVGALVAATINFGGHKANPEQGAALAVLSLIGITVWEIRSGAKHRPALRAMGMLAEPRPRLGAAFVLRYRSVAWWAWSASVADPRIRTRAEAIASGLRLRDARNAQRDRQAGAKVARRVALVAAKRGQTGQALTALRGLSAAWSVPMALPSMTSVSVVAETSPATETVLNAGPSVHPASSGNGPDCGPEMDQPELPPVDRKQIASAVHPDRSERTATGAGSRTVRRTTTRTAPETTNVRSIATPTDRQLKTLRKRFPGRVPTAGEIKTELGINSQSRALELRAVIKSEQDGSREATQ